MPHKNKIAESGNVLWFILLAVVLLASLTFVMTRSGSNVDQSGDLERLRIEIGESLRYLKGIEAAIQQMRLQGIGERQISFQNGAAFPNTQCTTNDCRIFHVNGGGQTYIVPSTTLGTATDWVFTAANNVGTTAGPIGTTAAGTGNDLLAVLPNVTQAACRQFNRELNDLTAIPIDETGIITTLFNGTYPASLNILDGDATPFELNRVPAGCFQTTDSSGAYFFYYTLLAR